MVTVGSNISQSETLIGRDVGVVLWVNDKEGERPYQLAYDHDDGYVQAVMFKCQIGQSVRLPHDQFLQAFWQHLRKELEWWHCFQSPLPLSHPWS